MLGGCAALHRRVCLYAVFVRVRGSCDEAWESLKDVIIFPSLVATLHDFFLCVAAAATHGRLRQLIFCSDVVRY